MGTLHHKIVNADLIVALENLVTNLGGIIPASKFLKIGQNTLKGYLDGSKKEIRNDIWHDKLSSLIKKEKNELLKYYASELVKLRKYEEKHYMLEYQIEYLEKDYNELLQKYISSPFNIYFSEFVDYDVYYHFPIIKEITELRDGSKVSFDKLVRDVDKFKRLYELFRPETISQHHHYFGTVILMDSIYDTFATVFKIEYNEHFSKFGRSWIEQVLKKELDFSEVNLDHLISDLNHIKKCINGTIFDLAIENYSYFERYSSYEYSRLIYEYLKLKYIFDVDDQIIENINPGKIKVSNKEYRFDRAYELFQILDDNNYKRRNDKVD